MYYWRARTERVYCHTGQRLIYRGGLGSPGNYGAPSNLTSQERAEELTIVAILWARLKLGNGFLTSTPTHSINF